MLTNHIPIVYLTAKADKASRLEGWRRDIDEYLTKPFDPKELLLRLKNILSIRQILASKLISSSTTGCLPALATIHDVFDKHFLTKLELFVEDNYSNSKLNLAIVAKEIAMSQRQLQRKLKAIIEKGLPEYLRDYRLARSEDLLKEGYSVGEVAYQCGFASQSYFSACFKAQYDTSPKIYQQTKLKK
jgi:AraC-like DNA-binding protein